MKIPIGQSFLGRQLSDILTAVTFIALSAIVAIIFSSPSAQAEEIIQKGQMLTLSRCIEIARERHPGLASARSTIGISESRVGQAKAGYYPQIYWSSTYSRKYPEVSVGRFGLPVRTHDSYNDYLSALTLSQNILDFNKTKTQVEIQKMNVTAGRSDLDYIESQIILAVKQSYFGLLQADRARAVSVEAVDGFQKHLDQAKAFFQAGVKPKFDVTKAEVDLSNARLNLLKVENSLKVARVNLNNAMGTPNAPEYTLEDDFTFVKAAITFENALQKAYNSRADLLSLSAKKAAAQKTIDLAKKGYYPVLSGDASYYVSGEEFPLNKGWSVGATLNFPLFTGHSTKYQVEEAKAALNVLNANEVALRQSIHLEVQQAYLALKEAEDRIDTLNLTVKQANENYDLANGRYASGVGSPIEVTDALLTVSNTKLSYIAALYDYKTAQGNIEKATGSR
jgi:outer membrane protein